MPTLSDKLKSLGVKVGTADIQPKTGSQASDLRQPPDNLEVVLHGRRLETHIGETFIVEQILPVGSPYGGSLLQLIAPLDAISIWVGDERLRYMPPQGFAFLDTETTGLSGGAGTYAFLIGVGKYEGDNFHLAQFFMRDPSEEPAQLAALEEFLSPCQALVSYNGKAFDIPLLVARYITHGLQIPFRDYAHVDLLHLSRRLWRDRLPSRTLGNVEAQILRAIRTEQDVPGWMIPQMYFDYLHSGDAEPMRGVFYHNAMDVISLAVLLNHTAGLVSDPLHGEIEHGVDLIALARLHEDMGNLDLASRLYSHGLHHLDVQEQRMPEDVYLQGVARLAAIHKRSENLQAAIGLWEEAAQHRHIPSHIELAKAYEHRLRDYQLAIYWTRTAIELVSSPGFSRYEHKLWMAELEHRLERLMRKLDNNG